jgi:hypothetical protein
MSDFVCACAAGLMPPTLPLRSRKKTAEAMVIGVGWTLFMCRAFRSCVYQGLRNGRE